MDNKKLLAFIAVLMLSIGVVCVVAAVLLTAPAKEPVPVLRSDDPASPRAESLKKPEPPSAEPSAMPCPNESADSGEVEVGDKLVLPPGTVLNSPIALVYDLRLGTVIFGKNVTTITAPASLTKLLTAIVALGYLKPEQRLTVGEEINLIGENSSTAFLAVGQRYSVRTLIDALLLPSGNDAAYVLAVNAARAAANDAVLSMEKSLSDFVRLMNDEAHRLGCVDSVFCTPDGYDAEGQQTTAADLLKIAAAARENATIRESVAKTKSGGWENSNLLLRPSSVYYRSEVTGMKTGSTQAAGYNIIVSADVENKTYILVIMASRTPNERYTDVTVLLDAIAGVGGEVSGAAQQRTP